MDNKAIAAVFEEIGNILDIKGVDFFRVNAYRKGAQIVENLSLDLRNVVEKNPQDLKKIPGIGRALEGKIIELVQTGKCTEHERLKKSIPAGLLEMLHLRTLGPKKVKMFYSKLGIKSIKELKDAAEKGEIRELERMGEKSEAEILKAIEEHSRFSTKRNYIHEAQMEANRIMKYMSSLKDIIQMEFAGSLRRKRETIGDVDILVTVNDPEKSREKIMKYFTSYKEVLTVMAEGDTKSSVLLQSGVQIDLRVINDECFGAALHYFTGSKEHNVRIRDIAKKKGLKVNEYGVFKRDKMIAGKTEEDLFKTLGLPYIIPEIRRNDGEVDYGLKHKKFPNFVELSNLRGDLHCHSKYSDGKNTVEEMLEVMLKKNYDYFAMTDHSSIMGVTGGMGTKEIKQQWKEIDKLNKKYDGKIKILKGSEIDILKDGSLDFSDEVLEKLDVVLMSAHLYHQMPEDKQTERLITAIENPHSMILAHPTGRLINKRVEIRFDMERIINACVKNKVALEINASPMRLDLSEKYIKIGKAKGAKFVISSDSHALDHPDFMEFGVGMARRGWLTKDDILNSKSLKEFDSYFK